MASNINSILLDGVDIILKLQNIINDNQVKLDQKLESKLKSFIQQSRNISNNGDTNINHNTASLVRRKPRLLKSKSMNLLVQQRNDAKDRKLKNSSIQTRDTFSAKVTSVVIKINETLKPIKLSSVHRLFNEEKEWNEHTISHINTDTFCKKAKQYRIEPFQSKRILSQLQSINDHNTPKQSPQQRTAAHLKVQPRIIKSKSMNALRGIDDESKHRSRWNKEKWLQEKDKLDGIMHHSSAKTKPHLLKTQSMNSLKDDDDYVSKKEPLHVSMPTEDEIEELLDEIHGDEEEKDIISEYMSYFNRMHTKTAHAQQRQCTLQSNLLETSSMKALTDCTDDSERELLMKDKLELCEFICDFNDTSHTQCIENKKALLEEILGCVQSNNKWDNVLLFEQFIKTISFNLFRSFPPLNEFDDEYDDPAWEHIECIYELTSLLIKNTSVDRKVMIMKHVKGTFLRHLIMLLRSPDTREAQYLKILIHAIYGRFMELREEIRRCMNEYCYQYIYVSTYRDSALYQGIPEILEVYAAAISGISLPVKGYWYDMLRNVLIPLHKTFHLDEFHDVVMSCCAMFLSKDPNVITVIFGGLLKFWPHRNPVKEQLFISEIVELFDVCLKHKDMKQSDPVFMDITDAVLRQLIQCMASTHEDVSYKAMMALNDYGMQTVVDVHREKLSDYLNKTLCDNKESHWSFEVRSMVIEELEKIEQRKKENDIENDKYMPSLFNGIYGSYNYINL